MSDPMLPHPDCGSNVREPDDDYETADEGGHRSWACLGSDAAAKPGSQAAPTVAVIREEG